MNQSVVNKMKRSMSNEIKFIPYELSEFELNIEKTNKLNNENFIRDGENSLRIMIEKGLIHSINNVSIKIVNGLHVLKYNAVYIHNGISELYTKVFKKFPHDLMICIQSKSIDRTTLNSMILTC